MHFTSSLVPHPQLKLVNKFGNLKSIKQVASCYDKWPFVMTSGLLIDKWNRRTF